jgi:protein-tyrosine phosphatase
MQNDLRLESAAGLTSLRLGNGALAIGHRPPLRALRHMREAGVTHVVSILARAEGPESIEAAARAASLEWIWIELGSTKNLPARRKPDILAALGVLVAALEAGGRLYLHCSAGIHRTGMIAAALMFHLGFDEAQTREAITALRRVTGDDMGQARMDWARSFA